MRIPDPASIEPIDEACAKRIRARALQGLLGCLGLWILAASLATAQAFELAGYALALAVAPWLRGVRSWIQFWSAPWSPGWRPSWGDKTVVLFLALFAIPALAPASLLLMIHAPSVVEVLPDRHDAQNHLRRAIGELPADAVTLVYHSRRKERPLDSEFVDILQFSVHDAATATRLLSGAGLTPSSPDLSDFEKRNHPREFPSLWRPFALGPDLEVWRANGAVAWVDSKNLTVYVMLSPGWRSAVSL